MPNNNARTMAFQVDEPLFLRIKAPLERKTARTGHKLTQREFVLGLIEQALNEAEREANVSPCDGPDSEVGIHPHRPRYRSRSY